MKSLALFTASLAFSAVRQAQSSIRTAASAMMLGWLAVSAQAKPVPAARPVPYNWKNVNIGGGGWVSGVYAHPRQKDAVFIRTDVGGAFRWNEATRSWSALTDGLGTGKRHLLGVNGLALDPKNSDIIYIAGGSYVQDWEPRSGAILKSRDGGATWASVTPADWPVKIGDNEYSRWAGERLVVDPDNGQTLLYGSNASGLWRSADAGSTWTHNASLPGLSRIDNPQTWWNEKQIGVTAIAFDALRSGRVYAAVYGEGVWQSDDAGVTWAEMSGSPRNVFRMTCGGDKVWTTGDDGVQFSKGNKWNFVAPAQEAKAGDLRYSALTVNPRDPNDVLVATGVTITWKERLFRTRDGGQSWREVATTITSSLPWLAHEAMAETPGSLLFDPHTPGRVWCASGFGVFRCAALDAPVEKEAEVVTGFRNGSMSEGVDVPLGWENKWTAKGRVKATTDTREFQSGPASLRVENEGEAAEGSLWQEVEVPGKAFSLRGFVRREPAAGATLESGGGVSFSDAAGKYVGYKSVWDSTKGDGAWQPFSADVTPPAGATTARITLNFKGQGQVWLDEISVGPPQNTILPALWEPLFKGQDETVVAALGTPPGVPLLSGVFDVSGFLHDAALDTPPSQRLTTRDLEMPKTADTYAFAWPQIVGQGGYPPVIVRAISSRDWGNFSTVAVSRDGGLSWKPTKVWPKGNNSTGFPFRVAVSAKNPQNWVATIARDEAQWTRDGGVTWQNSVGLPKGPSGPGSPFNPFQWLAADGARDGVFYFAWRGKFYRSTDGGANFSLVETAIPVRPTGNDWEMRLNLKTVAGVADEVWMTLGQDGLWRSRDGGTTWEKIEGIAIAGLFAAGKARAAGQSPTLYLYGSMTGQSNRRFFIPLTVAPIGNRLTTPLNRLERSQL